MRTLSERMRSGTCAAVIECDPMSMHLAARSKPDNLNQQKAMTMKTTLKLATIALAFAVSLTLAPDTQAKMKATKDCAACCKQGGDCCDKCGDDKCVPCCDKKANDKEMMKDHIMMKEGDMMGMDGEMVKHDAKGQSH